MLTRLFNKLQIRKFSYFKPNNIENIIKKNITGNFIIWKKDNALITDTIITPEKKQQIKSELNSYINIKYFIKINSNIFEYCISNNLNRQNFIDILNHPLITSRTKYYTRQK